MNKHKEFINKKLEELKRITFPIWSHNEDDEVAKVLEEIYTKGYDTGYNLGNKHGKDTTRSPY